MPHHPSLAVLLRRAAAQIDPTRASAPKVEEAGTRPSPESPDA